MLQDPTAPPPLPVTTVGQKRPLRELSGGTEDNEDDNNGNRIRPNNSPAVNDAISQLSQLQPPSATSVDEDDKKHDWKSSKPHYH